MQPDIAWAAGFFEGEGCISLDRRSSGSTARVKLSVNQVDVEPLKNFMIAAGIGSISHRKSKNAHWRDQWVWHGTGPSAAELLHRMSPWLSTRRRLKAAEVRLASIKSFISLVEVRHCVICDGLMVLSPIKARRGRWGKGKIYCGRVCANRAAKDKA